MLNVLPNKLSNFLVQLQRVNARQVFVPIVLAFALLFSFISHGNHYDLALGDLTSSSAEQNCHLCQQNIDNVDNNVEIIQPLVSRFLSFSSNVVKPLAHSNYSVTPPLRAPPVQL
ncbi:hypothetical protein [Pseudocolwellia agarivorans]|uniref:hypothetical protein n=1 Tax=Pseudocolwellia agarivorans TaxID=1911682 RepID=UPI0009847CC2|nr:hypothetical protein [Pseudocolwellia agarivorans]